MSEQSRPVSATKGFLLTECNNWAVVVAELPDGRKVKFKIPEEEAKAQNGVMVLRDPKRVRDIEFLLPPAPEVPVYMQVSFIQHLEKEVAKI